MPLVRTPKHAVASELLNSAMKLYLQGDNYYSALHLGGAAEEVLSVYARGINLVPCYDNTKQAIVSMAPMWPGAENEDNERAVTDLMNEAKNAVKHKRGSRDDWVEFDPREEAGEVIERALSTYLQIRDALALSLPALTLDFHEERRSAPSGVQLKY